KPAEPPKPAEAPKVAEAPKTPAAPPKAPAAPSAAAKKPPPPPPSFMDEMLDNWPYLAIGGVALAGIIGGLMFMRRRKATAEAGPSSGMTSAFPSDLKPDSTTG